MIFYTLFYAYPKSDKVNIVLTAVIIYLVCYALIFPAASSSIPFGDLLGDTVPLLISAIVFVCDVYLMSGKMGVNRNSSSNKENNKKDKKHKGRVRFNTRKNRVHRYPGYKTPQHPNPYARQQQQQQQMQYQQLPSQDQMMLQYQMLAQQYGGNPNNSMGNMGNMGDMSGMGSMGGMGGSMSTGAVLQYNPNDIKVNTRSGGPPDSITTKGMGGINWERGHETESEGESVLVSDTSSEISFSEEEY